MSRARQVSVFGASSCDPELAAKAEAVGRGLAEAGVVLMCGGTGGVMEAAAKGATEAGGVAIGILMGEDQTGANEHLTHTVATGIGQARNLAVAASGEVVIAIGGSWGTLSEIALARKLGRTVVALESWEIARKPDGLDAEIVVVETAEAAVAAALEALPA